MEVSNQTFLLCSFFCVKNKAHVTLFFPRKSDSDQNDKEEEREEGERED